MTATAIYQRIDIHEAAKKIGLPVEQWPGKCFQVATAFVNHGIVQGHAVYGHWRGKIDPHAPVFGERAGHRFVHHGWILQDDGTVVDPTRWVFENVEPYIFVGQDDDDGLDWCICGHLVEEHKDGFFRPCKFCDCCEDFEKDQKDAWPYDEGGDQLRAEMRKPPPLYDSDHKIDFHLRGTASQHCLDLINGAEHWSRDQVFWLANLPYADHGPHVVGVYQALARAGLLGLIPMDNRNRAEREFNFKLKPPRKKT